MTVTVEQGADGQNITVKPFFNKNWSSSDENFFVVK